MRPTAERLRELLHYEPETGVFTRLVSATNSVKVGEIASYRSKQDGYGRICVDGKQYLAHRLAWLYMTREWPRFEVDHIDTDRFNNRWANLRDVPTRTNSENKRSARRDNKSSGLLGVTFDKSRDKWQAQIGFRDEKGKRCMKALGRFNDPSVAHEAYLQAKRRMHAGCTI